MPLKFSFDATDENAKFLRGEKESGFSIGATINAALEEYGRRNRKLVKQTPKPKRKEHK